MTAKSRQTVIAAVAALSILGAGAFMYFTALRADTGYYNPNPTFKKPSEFPKEAFK